MFRKICYFEPLSFQKIAIMAPFVGYVASSQKFWNERDQNHNILKLRGESTV